MKITTKLNNIIVDLDIQKWMDFCSYTVKVSKSINYRNGNIVKSIQKMRKQLSGEQMIVDGKMVR